MRIKLKRIGTRETIFFISLFLLCMLKILSSSLYGYQAEGSVHTFFSLIRYSILLLMVIQWLAFEGYTIKKFLCFVVIIGVVIIVWRTISNANLILYVGIILSGQGISFKKILRFILWNVIVWDLFVIISCFLGILEDYIFNAQLLGESVTAHSIGFSYYSTLGYSAIFISIAWIYLKKEISYIELVIILILNYLFCRIHTNDLSFFAVIAFIFGYIIIKKWNIVTFKKKLWLKIASVLPFLFFFMTLFIVFLYAMGKFKLVWDVLASIDGRLVYSLRAFTYYSVNLFGNNVEMEGMTQAIYGSGTSFYIDSGYVYILLVYGIVFAIILLSIYSMLCRYAYFIEDPVLFLWIILILLISVINDFLLNAVFNPILFLAPEAIFQTVKRRTAINLTGLKVHNSD